MKRGNETKIQSNQEKFTKFRNIDLSLFCMQCNNLIQQYFGSWKRINLVQSSFSWTDYFTCFSLPQCIHNLLEEWWVLEDFLYFIVFLFLKVSFSSIWPPEFVFTYVTIQSDNIDTTSINLVTLPRIEKWKRHRHTQRYFENCDNSERPNWPH